MCCGRCPWWPRATHPFYVPRWLLLTLLTLGVLLTVLGILFLIFGASINSGYHVTGGVLLAVGVALILAMLLLVLLMYFRSEVDDKQLNTGELEEDYPSELKYINPYTGLFPATPKRQVSFEKNPPRLSDTNENNTNNSNINDLYAVPRQLRSPPSLSLSSSTYADALDQQGTSHNAWSVDGISRDPFMYQDYLQNDSPPNNANQSVVGGVGCDSPIEDEMPVTYRYKQGIQNRLDVHGKFANRMSSVSQYDDLELYDECDDRSVCSLTNNELDQRYKQYKYGGGSFRTHAFHATPSQITVYDNMRRGMKSSLVCAKKGVDV